MASIADYDTANKKALSSVATNQWLLRQAVDGALEGTKAAPGDFYINPSRLSDDAVRATFKDAVFTGMKTPYNAAIAALPGDADTESGAFLRGMWGFGRQELDAYVDGTKGGFQFDGLFKFLGEKTGYQDALAARFDHARSVMDQVSTADVVTHTGITPVDPSKITLDDKLEVNRLFDQFGVVPPKSIEDKPYMN
jgi:hypothetical protein